MKERIQQFINYKKVLPGELALRLNVQRSNISHILNGRNKPGAIFIENFLNEFPEINARWLLTGKGEMIVSKKEKVHSLFPSEEMIVKEKKAPVTTALSENVVKSEPPPVYKSKQPDLPVNSRHEEKSVEKIVIFYSDKTFKEYRPE